MSKISYALEKGGPKRLTISWKGNFKETVVRLDDNEIGRIDGYEQLREGKEFNLEDGSSLKVQLERKKTLPFPSVLKDGRPLTIPGLEPEKRLSMAYKITFFIAGANIVFGLTGSLLKTTSFNLPTGGIWSVVIGCVFFVLAIFIMRKSMTALSIAVGMVIIDLLLAIIFRGNIPTVLLIAIIVFRILILFVMIQGFVAIKVLKEEQAKTSDTPNLQ